MSALPVPRVEVHESPDELATTVAGAFLRFVTVRQASGDVPQVALTGGTIAEKIHREIARLGLDSESTGAGSTSSGATSASSRPTRTTATRRPAAAMLDVLPVDPARVHEIPSTADTDSVDDAATAYADTVRSVGRDAFDLLMLGVGPDGHIASLFPGFPQLDIQDAIAVGVTGSPKPPPERVTLTFPALARSEEVWFVVSGADKAEAVGRALAAQPAGVHEIPATGVRGQVETIWFLDREAASQVP